MPRFRKKPVVIEAVQYDGSNPNEIVDWSDGHVHFLFDEQRLAVYTLEGCMKADLGDWIIKGVQGEFYPCKPDIFEATYEAVEG